MWKWDLFYPQPGVWRVEPLGVHLRNYANDPAGCFCFAFVFAFIAEKVSRLVGLLDKDQDGLVSYKELLAFMLQHLDRRRDRLPEVLAAVRDQLRPLRKSRRGLLKRLAEMCELVDSDRSGRLRPEELRKATDAVGVTIPLADAHVLSETLDTLGDGRIPWATIVDELAREDDYFPRVAKSIGSTAGTGALRGRAGPNRDKQQRLLASASVGAEQINDENGDVDAGTNDAMQFAAPADVLLDEVRRTLTDAGVRLRDELVEVMSFYDTSRCGMLSEAHLFGALVDVAPELSLSKREKQALLRGVRRDQQGRLKYVHPESDNPNQSSILCFVYI